MKRSAFIIDLIFVVVFAAFLGAGALRAYLCPIETNEYENRTAEQMPRPSLSTLLDGSFQEGCESALADQTPYAIPIKHLYNDISVGWQLRGVNLLRSPDRFVKFGDFLVHGDHLVAIPVPLSQLTDGMDARAADINAALRRTPDVRAYAYYIERDFDTDYRTGQPIGCYDYLLERLDTTLFSGIERFRVPDIATFERDFYKIDHHWNAVGSYRAYREVLQMIAPEATPLEPTDTVDLPYAFIGSRARMSGAPDAFPESISAYAFDLPAIELTINADTTVYDHIGGQTYYLSGLAQGDSVSYADFYGYDSGQLIFNNPNNTSGENLLIIGDSYDNALLWLLSGSFDAVCSIDLRYYEHSMGTPFSYADYVSDHNITTVLLIGRGDFFADAQQKLES